MPDVYLSARGGWDTTASNVMKEHYQKEKEKESKRYAARMRHRFEKVLKNV